jgi:MerR family transcriptional regulator, thiopeptide resistance regulator
MLTVSRLARLCGLSRTTVLYYESIGLLTPARRGTGRYRTYSEPDISRLRQICSWRHAGLKLDDIQTILAQPESDISAVLKRRLMELEAEIETKRNQQKSILLLLREKETHMTKEKWTSIMRAAGLSGEDMRRWHGEFERAAPEDHREFLEYLHIPGSEIETIREWSRKK